MERIKSINADARVRLNEDFVPSELLGKQSVGNRTPSIARDVAHWCAKLVRGARCTWKLNRSDASPLVHTLCNFGETAAALHACKQIIEADPQNAYAYIHLIDLLTGQFGDFYRAQKYYEKGLVELGNVDSRELLASFYFYTCCVRFPVRRLRSLFSND